jgi:hypothetical protein
MIHYGVQEVSSVEEIEGWERLSPETIQRLRDGIEASNQEDELGTYLALLEVDEEDDYEDG